MSELPRIAVVGAGRWGRNLVRNFHDLGVLAAICDQSSEVLADHRERIPELQYCVSFEQLLAHDDIDAIALATPSVTHAALAAQCLEAGKSLFVEKPLCMEPGQARELTDTAKRAGLTLMTGHLLLYHPAFVALRDFVRGGGVGEVRYISAHRLNFRGSRSEDDVLWDIAPHDVSMLLALTGCLPRSVVATASATIAPGQTDAVHLSADFGENIKANIAVSWIHPYKEQRLIVAGNEGLAVFDDLLPGARKLVFQRQSMDAVSNRQVLRDEPTPLAYGPSEPLALECQEFIARLQDQARDCSDAADACEVVQVLKACEVSAVEHRAIDPAKL